MIRILTAVVLVVAVAGCRVNGRPLDEPKRADPPKAEFKLTADEQAVLEATNAERKKAKLDPLSADPQLTEAARKHAANMARQAKLDHTLDGKDAADRIKAAGYSFRRMGENIAHNYQTPADAVDGWMKSKGHKENLLNAELTHIGVAVAKSDKGEPYWVQVFATPLK